MPTSCSAAAASGKRRCPLMREDLQELAELTSDEQLRKMADLYEVRVPLGHLRHLDPQTRIVLGLRLDYTAAERQWLSSKPGRADRGIACLLGDYVIPGIESDLA